MERDGEIRLRFLGGSPVSSSKYFAFLEKGWGPITDPLSGTEHYI